MKAANKNLNIIYICTADKAPAGGPKVVYNHSDIINNLNENVLAMAKNTDILIHDSHFTEEDLNTHIGWGHSSWKQAVNVAIKSNAKKLFLFHYSPEYNDDLIDSIEQKAQKLLETCEASRQNLKVVF